MNFNPDEILQVASAIWEATLRLPIEPEVCGTSASRARATAALIQLTGAWSGAVVLDCPVDMARLAASIMFGTDPAKVTVTDLQDAVAELVNMVGGNVKGLLPPDCYLSLPTAVEGGDYSARVPGSRVVTRVSFSCAGYSVMVSVLEKLEQRTAAA